MAKNNQKITTCLWFDHQAEEASRFYVSVFKNSHVGRTAYFSESTAKASGQIKGSILTVEFELEGASFLALNGGPHFKINPSISLFVSCESESEIDKLWSRLAKETRMELAKYPFAEKYGWCEDQFGVNWQLILSPRQQKIVPALLFANEKFGKAEEAIQFYTSQIPDSKIQRIARDERTGAVLHGVFTLGGQDFIAMEGPLEHEFGFSPAVSFIIHCKTQEEIDFYWEKLSFVPEAEQCGWLADKYGISWQIVPALLPEILAGTDRAKIERAMQVVLKSKKLNIKAIEQA